MIAVEEAIARVIASTQSADVEILLISPLLLGRTLAEDIVAKQPFPSFRASIMDGYAVKAPLNPGSYHIQSKIFAGAPNETLQEGRVCYITTGARVPDGATAVVKIEDTSPNINPEMVDIKVAVVDGIHIRAIGSDINEGEIILSKGHVLKPTDIGLIATVGHARVMCYKKPVIGVMSTGSELVDPWVEPTGTQIRDSNRITLLTAFQLDGFDAVDFGIVVDSKEDIKATLLRAAEVCDVVVTSGGVSMGTADFVKPLLRELGTIHFDKLNMKPGKPTTFATLKRQQPDGTNKTTLFFGLPGNPVSCVVTKTLFVDPALKRLQGLPAAQCLHPQLKVKLVGSDLTLDPERAEYHRASIVEVQATGVICAESTGNQRSSRLLSMKSANLLLCLPQGPGKVAAGSMVDALLTGPIPPPPASINVHRKAASFDNSAEVSKDSPPLPPSEGWKVIKTALLTVSDRASQGVYADESGPMMGRLLKEMSEAADFPLKINIVATAIVPDDQECIRRIIEQWSDPSSPFAVDFILTSGGTGFGIRDLTPEAIRPLLHREAPGVAQALLNEGLKYTPLAVLSRPMVGTRYSSFICTLPGSVKAVKENIVALKPLLPRILQLIKNGDCQ